MKLGGDCVETEKLGGLKVGVVNFTTHVYISQKKNERINILTWVCLKVFVILKQFLKGSLIESNPVQQQLFRKKENFMIGL